MIDQRYVGHLMLHSDGWHRVNGDGVRTPPSNAAQACQGSGESGTVNLGRFGERLTQSAFTRIEEAADASLVTKPNPAVFAKRHLEVVAQEPAA